jgi:hypothetical protein
VGHHQLRFSGPHGKLARTGEYALPDVKPKKEDATLLISDAKSAESR